MVVVVFPSPAGVGDQDQFCVFFFLLVGKKRKIKLRFIFSVKLEIFFVNAGIFGNFGNGADGRFLRDFNIT